MEAGKKYKENKNSVNTSIKYPSTNVKIHLCLKICVTPIPTQQQYCERISHGSSKNKTRIRMKQS